VIAKSNPWVTHRPAAPVGARLGRQATTLLATAIAAVVGLGLLAWDETPARLTAPSPSRPAGAGASGGDAAALTLDAAARRAMDLAVQRTEPTNIGPDLTPALLVPAGGVVRESLGQAHVWVALDSAHFARRQVTPLAYAEGSGRIAVTGALAPGEAVVTHGALFLDTAAGR
jgi:hypothetical protein